MRIIFHLRLRITDWRGKFDSVHDLDFDIVKDMLFLKSGQFQSHQKERKGLHPPPQTKDKHKNRYVLLCRPEFYKWGREKHKLNKRPHPHPIKNCPWYSLNT